METNKFKFKDVVLKDKGFLRGPFGGDLKKEIFVPKDHTTYKVYEQGVVLQKDESIGRYYISKEYYDKKMYKFEVKPKDFLVSCSGVNYGAIYQLRENAESGVINQALLRIRLNNKVINDDFFYYYFNFYLVNLIVGKKGDSTIPNFPPISVIKELEFDLPNITIQDNIVVILKNIDSKIELNNKINKELEAMAKILYDYWFVQFDFPDENGKPYKSSGGKMVYNQELKREIPEAWEVKKLQEFLEFEKGIEPGASEYLNLKMNEKCVKFFRVGDIQSESSVYIDSTNKNYKIVNERDVIVTFDGSVGKLGFGLKGAISGGLRKIYDKSGKFDNSLIYCIFCDNEIIKTIHRYATGSILLHASSSIEHLKIVFKEESYLKFQKIIKPIFNQMIQSKKQNQELAKLRDWLLPMLMNGQVRVTDNQYINNIDDTLMVAEPSETYGKKDDI